MRMKALGLSTLVVAFLAAPAGQAHAQTSIGFVAPSDLGGATWTGFVSGGGQLGFVADPSGDGFGTGTLQFAVKDPNADAELRFSDIGWASKLSDIISIHYRALAGGKQCARPAPPPGPGPAPKKPSPDRLRSLMLLLDVDTDGDFVADDVLVFDPSLNGDVQCGVPQVWSAIQGSWYSASDKDGAKHAQPLSAYLSKHPDARIVFGGIRIVAGLDEKDFVGNLDSLSLEGPPICVIAPGMISCVDGPAPIYFFRVAVAIP
jgi:hypothetical protein